MLNSQYDAIITNIAGSGSGYYKKGINIKLFDNTTVINIWKPGRCPCYNGEVYKDLLLNLVVIVQTGLRIQI